MALEGKFEGGRKSAVRTELQMKRRKEARCESGTIIMLDPTGGTTDVQSRIFASLDYYRLTQACPVLGIGQVKRADPLWVRKLL